MELFFFFQAEDGIRDADVTGVQTCALPITALQSARDVIFPAPLAHLESSRRGDAPLAGVEPHHNLAQTHQVPAALFLWPDRQRHAFTSTAHPNGRIATGAFSRITRNVSRITLVLPCQF